MAQITWRNVDGNFNTSGVTNAYSTLNNAVGRFGNVLGDYFSKTLVDRENRIEQANINDNTAYALNLLNSASSKEDMNNLIQSGAVDLSFLDRVTNGQLDKNKFVQAKSQWGNDVNQRFIAEDNLKMSDLEAQTAFTKAMDAYAKGDMDSFNSLLANYSDKFSMNTIRDLANKGFEGNQTKFRNDLEERKFLSSEEERKARMNNIAQLNKLNIYDRVVPLKNKVIEAQSKLDSLISKYNEDLHKFSGGVITEESISLFNQNNPEYIKQITYQENLLKNLIDSNKDLASFLFDGTSNNSSINSLFNESDSTSNRQSALGRLNNSNNINNIDDNEYNPTNSIINAINKNIPDNTTTFPINNNVNTNEADKSISQQFNEFIRGNEEVGYLLDNKANLVNNFLKLWRSDKDTDKNTLQKLIKSHGEYAALNDFFSQMNKPQYDAFMGIIDKSMKEDVVRARSNFSREFESQRPDLAVSGTNILDIYSDTLNSINNTKDKDTMYLDVSGNKVSTRNYSEGMRLVSSNTPLDTENSEQIVRLLLGVDANKGALNWRGHNKEIAQYIRDIYKNSNGRINPAFVSNLYADYIRRATEAGKTVEDGVLPKSYANNFIRNLAQVARFTEKDWSVIEQSVMDREIITSRMQDDYIGVERLKMGNSRNNFNNPESVSRDDSLIQDQKDKLKLAAQHEYLVNNKELSNAINKASSDADAMLQRVQDIFMYENIYQAKNNIGRMELTIPKSVLEFMDKAPNLKEVNALKLKIKLLKDRYNIKITGE